MSKKCRDCFHFYGVAEDMNGEVGMCELQSSDCPNYKVAGQSACEMFNAQTLFDHITESPEAMAEEFVEPYTRWGEDGHLETLWRSNFRELSGMLFDTKEEALSATVEKLKEVYNE